MEVITNIKLHILGPLIVFFWPNLFKYYHDFYLKSLKCQADINIDKRDHVPNKTNLEV